MIINIVSTASLTYFSGPKSLRGNCNTCNRIATETPLYDVIAIWYTPGLTPWTNHGELCGLGACPEIFVIPL